MKDTQSPIEHSALSSDTLTKLSKGLPISRQELEHALRELHPDKLANSPDIMSSDPRIKEIVQNQVDAIKTIIDEIAEKQQIELFPIVSATEGEPQILIFLIESSQNTDPNKPITQEELKLVSEFKLGTSRFRLQQVQQKIEDYFETQRFKQKRMETADKIAQQTASI